MMMRLIAAVMVLAAVGGVAAAQSKPKYGATVTAAKNVDFAKLHTYSWRRALPSSDKAIDSQIIAAIDRELAGLAMTRVESGPADVLVAYSSLTRTDVDVKGKVDAKGLLPQYWVGTLVVALTDPASNQQLLRMRVDLPIETQRDQLEAAINRAAALMFAEYPTRRRR
jgi:uncharacterized protein DUF4136